MNVAKGLRRSCWYYNLCSGPVKYEHAWNWQQRLRADRIKKEGENLPDVLVLLEHEPVYTLGPRSALDFLKFDVKNPPCVVQRIERGGEVTFHGPGQVVGYPIVNLRNHKKDLRWYLHSLEEVIIKVLGRYGVKAGRQEGLTGVWFENRKLAAIGVAASRWVTMHGFSLNVSEDLSGFEQIVPCGIADKKVGALREFVPNADMEDVKHNIQECFAEHFDLQMHPYVENALELGERIV